MDEVCNSAGWNPFTLRQCRLWVLISYVRMGGHGLQEYALSVCVCEGSEAAKMMAAGLQRRHEHCDISYTQRTRRRASGMKKIRRGLVRPGES